MSEEIDQPASVIIVAFGGIRPMATKLEIPVSTVQGWKQRDTIPAGRMAAVRAAAEASGIDIKATPEAGAEEVPVETPLAEPPRKASPKKDATAPETKTPAPSAPKSSSGGGIAILALVVVLGVGGWVWWSTLGPGASQGDNARFSAIEGRIARLAEGTGADVPDVDALTRELEELRTRVSELPNLEISIAALRAEIDSLRSAVADAGTPGAADPEILARLDRLESEARNAVQIASTNMQATSGAMVEFETRLATLARAQDAARAAAEARIAALETGHSAEQVEVSRASALALAAGQVRTALERGAPFAEPLAVVQSLGSDDLSLSAVLEKLQPVAGAGVPTGAALELSFATLVPDLIAADRDDGAGDIVDRLADRINDIVSIRRTGADVPGDGLDARIARAEILLAGRDVAGAVSELSDVSGEPSALLAPWLTQARAHLYARDALADLEARAIARLRAESGS